MHWCGTLILLEELYLIIIMTAMIMFCSAESIADKRWLNHIEGLSAKMDEYSLDNKTMESHPFNEGFILITDNHKKSLPITSTSVESTVVVNRIFISDGIPSTTCKTITVAKAVKRSIAHLGRGLSNEPSYDTDIDTTSVQTVNEDDIESVLKIDDEEWSKQLVNIGIAMDGSGDTTEPTSEATSASNESITSENITTELTSISEVTSTSTIPITNSTTGPTEIILSGYSTFLIIVDCTDARAILTNILEQFNKTFPYRYNVTYNEISFQCPRSSDIEVSFSFFTDNNITILNNLFQILENIVSRMGIELRSFDTCGTKQTVSMKNITSCYLIDLCSLCGTNPRRGVCLPEKNVSKCECFINENNPSISYIDEFCKIQKEEPRTSTSSSWTLIIVGILAGIAGLFCVITIFLLVMIFLRRRRHYQKQKNSNRNEIQTNRLWALPRVRIPNVQDYTLDSTRSNTTNSPFFQELDQKMNENTRTTIRRPNTKVMLTRLPSDLISIRHSYDLIDELDAIIDNEDVNMTFHQPLDQDNESKCEITQFSVKKSFLSV